MRARCSTVGTSTSCRRRETTSRASTVLLSGFGASLGRDLGHARREELAHERGGQAFLRVEVERARRLLVGSDVFGERAQRSAAERVIRAAARARRESGDDSAVHAERGHPVADALFRLRHDRADLFAQLLEGGALRGLERLEIRVDGLGLRVGHAPNLAGATLVSYYERIVRQFLISFAATLVFVAIVLVSAGRLTVWQAWVYAGISLALNLGQRAILRKNPALARERATPARGARWDKVLLGVGLLLNVAMLVTAGLQLRHAASPSLSTAWFVAGVALSLAGGLVFSWALRENSFFSAVVRIHNDRTHAVCTTGPYRFVRHPGNLGMIIGTLGLPLLFQSSWSLVPAALSVIALLARTQLEDLLLTRELEGYRDYREKTRFRLVPGLW